MFTTRYQTSHPASVVIRVCNAEAMPPVFIGKILQMETESPAAPPDN